MSKLIYKQIEELKKNLKVGDFETAKVQLQALFLQQNSFGIATLELVNALCKHYGTTTETLLEKPPKQQNKIDLSTIKKLSQLDEIKPKQGISIVSCCMNRNDNLKKGLLTWLKLDVDEIVIVDWSSTTPVSETLSDINDPRIKIVRVENEPKWILTYGFNVGLRFASYEKIFKLDADIEVSPNFLQLNDFVDNEFVRGHWKSALDNGQDDQVYVNGSFGCYKEHLLNIGFYNEFIRTYGWDDSDIYSRLSNECGLATKYLSFDSIVHMEQDESERIVNQDILDSYFMGEIAPTEFNNQRNKYLVKLLDIWAKWHLQDYELLSSNQRVIILKRISTDFPIQKHIYSDSACYAVLLLLGWKYSELSWRVKDPKVLGQAIYDLYLDKVDFSETKALLGLSDDYKVAFAEGNVYQIINAYSELHKKSKKKYKVTIYRCCPESKILSREILNSSAGTFIITTLPSQRYLMLEEIYKNLNDNAYIDNINSKVTEHKVFATSVYDESEPHRLAEYMTCVTQNLSLFDSVVLFYEEGDGKFKQEVTDQIRALNLDEFEYKLIFINIDQRPSFKFIFNSMDRNFNGAQIFVSNADIVFDKTISRINKAHFDGNFLVLSRKEVLPETLEDHGFIMSQFGLPNTFSADVWAYQSPLAFDFRAEFGIGTFHCDSFLNYHISRSGYRLYNPCLDILNYHIHDAKFNSSEEKEIVQADKIQKSLYAEIDLCGGELPLKGVQWCRLADTLIPQRANQLVDWSDVIINIDVKVDGSNLITAMLQALMALKINSSVAGGRSVWLRVPSDEVHSNVTDILFMFKEKLGHKDLLIAVDNKKDELFAKDLPGYHKTKVSPQHLLETYQAVLRQTPCELFSVSHIKARISPYFGVHEKTHLLCDVESYDCDDLITYALLKTLSKQDKQYFKYVTSQLIDAGFTEFLPFKEDILLVSDIDGDLSTYRGLFDKTLHPENTIPQMSFVTSIFKGDEFFWGFLANTAAALLECNGEAILVDAASPGDEQLIFDRFITQYPGLSCRMQYIRLEADPGLYNCWQLGIQTAKAQWVGNANLDDRRSPFQARAMLDELVLHPAYKGAASAIRATCARNTGWFEITDNEYWFNNGFDQTISFDKLYTQDANGLVKSQNIMHCMPIWHKSLHEKYGFFNEEKYGTSADWAFWLECTQNGEVFCLVPQVLSQYYINEQSHNRVNDPNGIKENRIVKDYLDVSQTNFEQQ
ncbi:glycosyltransferase [Shewanella goraebulensis]|uniref:glycosyltransferase n=1 Tax=Shewanella goraebulensis TaxID=3050637 RepID=UPI00254BE2FE|nr:glycosyltransferase family 2 protein [Shewanella goraebulensis]